MKDKQTFELEPVERDFILLLFTRANRALLGREYRKLYDALFEKYKVIWSEGRKAKVDLGAIQDKFVATL